MTLPLSSSTAVKEGFSVVTVIMPASGMRIRESSRGERIKLFSPEKPVLLLADGALQTARNGARQSPQNQMSGNDPVPVAAYASKNIIPEGSTVSILVRTTAASITAPVAVTLTLVNPDPDPDLKARLLGSDGEPLSPPVVELSQDTTQQRVLLEVPDNQDAKTGQTNLIINFTGSDQDQDQDQD